MFFSICIWICIHTYTYIYNTIHYSYVIYIRDPTRAPISLEGFVEGLLTGFLTSLIALM